MEPAQHALGFYAWPNPGRNANFAMRFQILSLSLSPLFLSSYVQGKYAFTIFSSSKTIASLCSTRQARFPQVQLVIKNENFDFASRNYAESFNFIQAHPMHRSRGDCYTNNTSLSKIRATVNSRNNINDKRNENTSNTRQVWPPARSTFGSVENEWKGRDGERKLLRSICQAH